MKTTNQNQNLLNQVIEEQPRRTDHQVNQPAVVNTKVPMGYVPDEAPGDVIIDQIAETPETPATANATDPFPIDGPVAGLPTFTTVIDTPNNYLVTGFSTLRYTPCYQGLDAAETFKLRNRSMFTNGSKYDNFDQTIVDAEGGDDTVHGSNVNDFVRGGTGNDTIYGGYGSDQIEGGADNDVLYGQQGYDTMFGGSDNDVMFGGAGNDTMWGDWGRYSSGGLEGNDYLYGNAGNDKLNGQGGNDHLDGGTGNDILNGGGENDHLKGGDGYDWLFGDDGNDFLDGGKGIDVLIGGDGVDTFALSEGTDFITDFQTTGTQRDKISLQNVSGIVTVEPIINTNDVQIVYGFDGPNASDITFVENATSQQVFQSLINTENSTVYVY